MCAPAAIPVAMQWIMAGVTVAGGVMAADAQRQEGKFNAAVAENNQRIAVAQAEDANRQGARESEQALWRTRIAIGAQRAAIAANNVDPTMGTPAEILGQTAMFGEVDQQNIRANAARAAWGYNAQATNFGNQASLTRWSSRTGARMTILGSLARAGQQMSGGFGGGGGTGGSIGPVQREAIPVTRTGWY